MFEPELDNIDFILVCYGRKLDNAARKAHVLFLAEFRLVLNFDDDGGFLDLLHVGDDRTVGDEYLTAHLDAFRQQFVAAGDFLRGS